jgi:tripeptidyl-peptidase-1
VQFDAEAHEVEDLLFTDFFTFEHTATSSKGLACDEYHVPSHVSDHIDYITPGIRLRKDPREIARLNRRNKRDELAKRGIEATNTGAVPIPLTMTQLTSSGESPFNSSVCDTYITNQCIRSELQRIPTQPKSNSRD